MLWHFVLITLYWNYYFCSDSVGNKGAYINITPDKETHVKLDYVQFDAVEHPKTQPYNNRFRGGF